MELERHVFPTLPLPCVRVRRAASSSGAGAVVAEELWAALQPLQLCTHEQMRANLVAREMDLWAKTGSPHILPGFSSSLQDPQAWYELEDYVGWVQSPSRSVGLDSRNCMWSFDADTGGGCMMGVTGFQLEPSSSSSSVPQRVRVALAINGLMVLNEVLHNRDGVLQLNRMLFVPASVEARTRWSVITLPDVGHLVPRGEQIGWHDNDTASPRPTVFRDAGLIWSSALQEWRSLYSTPQLPRMMQRTSTSVPQALVRLVQTNSATTMSWTDALARFKHLRCPVVFGPEEEAALAEENN